MAKSPEKISKKWQKVLKKISKKMTTSLEKRKEKSEKSHEKMDALMKTWQTSILARKFESREKFRP
jgi:gas vesicle protein